MDYTLIKGKFYVVGHSPDGDSLKFKANNPQYWQALQQANPDNFTRSLAKEKGVIILRLEGIDALETHYSPPSIPIPAELKNKDLTNKPKPGNHSQPPEYADKATNALLQMLGIQQAEWRHWGHNSWIDEIIITKWGRAHPIKEKYEDGFPGYILTSEVERNGRPVSWIFTGTTSTRDGSNISPHQAVTWIEESLNYRLIEQGLVYPYFFMTLPGILRDKLAQAAKDAYQKAQQNSSNLWHVDDSLTGFRVTSVRLLNEKYVLYPYLYRRLLRHWYQTNMERYWDTIRKNKSFQLSEKINLTDFFNHGNPHVLVISRQDFVRLNEVLYINGSKFKLNVPPFDLVFLA